MLKIHFKLLREVNEKPVKKNLTGISRLRNVKTGTKSLAFFGGGQAVGIVLKIKCHPGILIFKNNKRWRAAICRYVKLLDGRFLTHTVPLSGNSQLS